jgi:branched-chain amino acid aminotransferase
MKPMNQPLAYLNGTLLPADQVSVPVYDAGFVLGASVTEQLRTFGGRLFRAADHLARLKHSLEIVDIDPGVSIAQMQKSAEELAARNHALMAEGDDLGLAIFVTPGPFPTLAPAGASGPIVCFHTYPLPFGSWVEKYDRGESLVVTDIQQVPPECWPRELKCRSRMHYYLADQAARRINPTARAVMLDAAGDVMEASTANLLVYDGRSIVAPPVEKVLPGISMAVIRELAEQENLGFEHRDLRPEEVAAAAEVLLTSTTICLQPVVTFNGQPISDGQPGPIFRQLLAAWNNLVGLDIVAQATKFANRPSL